MPNPQLAPPYPLLFQDEDVVAVHKPAGIGVKKYSAKDKEPDFLLGLENQLGRTPLAFQPIDKAASGVMICVFKPQDQQYLLSSFHEGKFMQEYWALLRGWTKEEGKIRDHLPARGSDSPQKALSAYKTLEHYELPFHVGPYPTCRLSLVQCRQMTYHRSQLRRHFRLIHHPVIGDTSYGDSQQNQFFRSWAQHSRLFLYSRKIQFLHPKTGNELQVKAPLLPPDQRVLDRLKEYQAF